MEAGTVSGAAGGAAIGAAACGPIFYGACVVGLSMIGMVAGMVAGSLYGFSGVSETDALYLTEVLSYIDQRRDLQSQLVDQVVRRLPPELLAPLEDAEVQALPRIEKIDFLQRSENRIVVGIYGSLTVATSGQRRVRDDDSSKFRWNSAEHDLDYWLAEDGRAIEAELDKAIVEFAKRTADHILAGARLETR